MHTVRHTTWWVTIKRLAAMLLMVLIIAPSLALSVAPKRADAQIDGFIAGAAGCLVTSAIGMLAPGLIGAVGAILSVPVFDAGVNAGTLQITGNTWADVVRECVLDPLVWTLKNMLIDQLTGEILTWIESGFEDSPTFISDPAQFFRDLNQNALNYWLRDADIYNQVCRPFRVELWVQLQIEASRPDYNPRGGYAGKSCTLEVDFGGWERYEDFMRGDTFSWDDFDSVMKNEQNNYGGAFLANQDAIARAQNTVAEGQKSLIAWNDGNLSIRCDENGDGVKESTCTPGRYIANQVDDWTGGGLAQLEAADEFAEIVNALIAALVMGLLTDARGLLSGGDKDWVERQGDIYGGRLRSPYEPVVLPEDPPEEPPQTLPASCIAALEDYKQALFGGLQSLQSAVFRASAEATWMPILNVFSNDLGQATTDASSSFDRLSALHDTLEGYDQTFEPSVNNVNVAEPVMGDECSFGSGGPGGNACGTLIVYAGHYAGSYTNVSVNYPTLVGVPWEVVPSGGTRGDMNDSISSIRLNGSTGWEVCRGDNYTGQCFIVDGDRNFTGDWDDRITSIRCSTSGGGGGGGGGGTTTPTTCPAQPVSWTEGTATCQGSLQQTTVNTSRTTTDSTAPLTGSATYACLSNGTWATGPRTATCRAPAPSLALILSENGGSSDGYVEVDTPFELVWSSTNVTSCVASGGLSGWSGSKAVPSGSQTFTSNVVGDYTFTLSCTNDFGGNPATRSVTMRVRPPACPAGVLKTWSDNSVTCRATTPSGVVINTSRQLSDPAGGGFTDSAAGYAAYQCLDVGGVATWSNTPDLAQPYLCCPVVGGVQQCP